MSNSTVHNAAEITGAIDEIIEYLRVGDENRQALMHANLLLTNLMRLLRPVMKPANAGNAETPTQYQADQAGFAVPRVSALKEAVERGISQIEHGEHSGASDTFTKARRYWTAESS